MNSFVGVRRAFAPLVPVCARMKVSFHSCKAVNLCALFATKHALSIIQLRGEIIRVLAALYSAVIDTCLALFNRPSYLFVCMRFETQIAALSGKVEKTAMQSSLSLLSFNRSYAPKNNKYAYFRLDYFCT